MPLKDLIATPGQIAASRITRNFDFSSHEAHSRLFNEIKEAVDSAVAADRKSRSDRSSRKRLHLGILQDARGRSKRT
ncbi:MAG TPA: hypothetical protein V6C97_27595 [Oculatellaceae cyanobacterium]